MAAAFALLFLIYFLLPSPRVLGPLGEVHKVPYGSTFRIDFSQPVWRRSVDLALRPELSGRWRWISSRSVEFVPEISPPLGSRFSVALPSGARSLLLKPLSFAVISFEVSEPPRPAFVWPQGQDFTGDPGQTLTVLFDRPMVFPERPLASVPELAGYFRFLSDRAFQFVPETWPASASFIFTVPAGLPARDGGATEEAVSWKLKTPPPHVVSVVPDSALKPFELSQAITVTFSVPAPLGDVQPGRNVLLFPSNDLDAKQRPRTDGFFNGDVTYSPLPDGSVDQHTLVISPTFPYQPDRRYRLVFKAGFAGLPRDTEFRFHTIAPLEEAPVPAPETGLETSLPLVPPDFADFDGLPSLLRQPDRFLDFILRYQRPDGGFARLPSGTVGDPQATAYALIALRGVLKEEALESATHFLLSQDPLSTLSLWALSESGVYDTPSAVRFFRQREALLPVERAMLALTFLNLKTAGQSGVAPFLERLKSELLDAPLVSEAGHSFFFVSRELARLDPLQPWVSLESLAPQLRPFLYVSREGGRALLTLVVPRGLTHATLKGASFLRYFEELPAGVYEFSEASDVFGMVRLLVDEGGVDFSN